MLARTVAAFDCIFPSTISEGRYVGGKLHLLSDTLDPEVVHGVEVDESEHSSHGVVHLLRQGQLCQERGRENLGPQGAGSSGQGAPVEEEKADFGGPNLPVYSGFL